MFLCAQIKSQFNPSLTHVHSDITTTLEPITGKSVTMWQENLKPQVQMLTLRMDF